MDYPGVSARDYVPRLPQQVQQGIQDPYPTPSSQFSNPQYPLLPPNSRPASYSAPPLGQAPPATFSSSMNGFYGAAPATNPGHTGSCPIQLPLQPPMQYPTQYPLPFPAPSPQVPLPQGGLPATLYGGLGNFQHMVPQYGAVPRGGIGAGDTPRVDFHQHELATRSLQQGGGSFRYEDLPANTNLATVHPTLGPCVLIPIRALHTPRGPGSWTNTTTAGSRRSSRCMHGDYHGVDHLHRRASRLRELTPYLRYMSPSPSTLSPSPYIPSPSSSAVPTPILRRRRLNAVVPTTNPSRHRGVGGFNPLHERDVPRPSIERSVSMVSSTGTCSQCAGTGSSYAQPFAHGSVTPTPRIDRLQVGMGQDQSSRGQVEHSHGGPAGAPAGGPERFQASVEEIDE